MEINRLINPTQIANAVIKLRVNQMTNKIDKEGLSPLGLKMQLAKIKGSGDAPRTTANDIDIRNGLTIEFIRPLSELILSDFTEMLKGGALDKSNMYSGIQGLLKPKLLDNGDIEITAGAAQTKYSITFILSKGEDRAWQILLASAIQSPMFDLYAKWSNKLEDGTSVVDLSEINLAQMIEREVA